MQNQEDQSKGPLSGESEASGQTLDLGRKIYARYAGSPGVIPVGLGPGLARQVYEFSDRVPLLHTLHRRWNMEGVPFPGAPSPLWLRALASPKSAEHSTALAPRMAGAGSFSTSSKPEGISGGAMPLGPEVQIDQPTQSAVRRVARVREGTGDSDRTRLTANRTGAVVRPGDSVPNVHVQRRAGAEYGRETKTASPMAGASSAIPQHPPAPGQAQMGPPIFWRQGRGALARTNRQNGVPPEKKQVGDSSAEGVPGKTSGSASLPASYALSGEKGALGRQRAEGEMVAGSRLLANAVHVTRPKAGAEVARAATSNPQRVPLANGSRDLAVGTTRNPGAEAGIVPEVAKTSQDSGSRRSSTPAHGDEQTDSLGPVVAAEHSIGGSVGESAAAPLVQRRATELPALRSRDSSAERVVEGAAVRMNPPVDGAVVSASKPGGIPLSGTSSSAPNANSLVSQLNVTGSPISAGLGSGDLELGGHGSGGRVSTDIGSSLAQRHVDGLIEHPAKPTAPPLLQRKGTALSSPGSKSHNADSLVEGAAEGMNPPIHEVVAPSSKLERVPLSVTPSAAPNADLVWNRPGAAGVIHRMDSPAVEASVSSSKAESIPLSGARIAAQNADAARSQAGVTGSPVSGDPGSRNPVSTDLGSTDLGSSLTQRHPDGLIAHPAKTAAPPLVQRGATPLPSARSGSSNAGSLAEGMAHRTDSPVRHSPAPQGAATSSRPEGALPTVVPSTAPSTDAVRNQPGVTGSPISGDQGSRDPASGDLRTSDTGSSLAQRDRDDMIAHPAIAARRVNETGETPVVRLKAMPSASPDAQPIILASQKIQLQSEGGVNPYGVRPYIRRGSAFAPHVLTPVVPEAPGVETEEPAASGMNAAQPPQAALSRIPIMDQKADQTTGEAPDATHAKLAQSSLHERPVFPNAGGAAPVMRRATRVPGSTATMGHPGFAATHALGFAGKSEVTHRVWRRADGGLIQAEAGHGVTHSGANFGVVQRSPANSGGATGVQTPPAPPSLPDQSNSMSQTLAGGDINQLTNRVYELLVRRLAGEKQQRGL
jgi:hypothetical protein